MLSLDLCERPALGDAANLPTDTAVTVIAPTVGTIPDAIAIIAPAVASVSAAVATVPAAVAAIAPAVATVPAAAVSSAVPANIVPPESLAMPPANVPTVASAASVSEAEPQQPEANTRPRWGISTRRLIVLAAIVLGLRIFVGEASVVPTASMEGTILVGDHLFMDKLLYGPEIPLVHWRLPRIKAIHRGDIVVFHYPKDPSETFLKRVAAVGGDRLEIQNGLLYVNSLPVQEPYAVHHAPIHSPDESWGPTVVPEGKLFVMGDNRDNSSDSRDWGFVPVGNVIGEPLFVYWSYDAPTSRWLDENLGHRVSFYASIAGNFFSHTRWSRTGMLL